MPAAPDTLRLGVMVPRTGLANMYGPELEGWARRAVAEVNRAGGVLGRPVELLLADDGSGPETAIAAAQELLARGANVLVGNVLSDSRLAVMARVAAPAQVPLLNFAPHEGSIANRFFFNFGALPNQLVERTIPVLVAQHGPRMFFAGNDYDWPRTSVGTATRLLRESGGEVAGQAYLSWGAGAGEIDELLDAVADSGAQVFVPYFVGTAQVEVLRRVAARGLREHLAVVGGHFDQSQARLLAPHERAGIYASASYFPEVLGVREVGLPGPPGDEAARAAPPTCLGASMHSVVHACAAAATAAGGMAPEGLLDALSRVEVAGLSGPVQMDPKTHSASQSSYLARCREDGTFEVLAGFGLVPPRIPPRHARAFAGANLSRPSPNHPPSEVGGGLEMPGDAASRLFSLVDVGLLATDASGTIVAMNRAAQEMFDYSGDEPVGRMLEELMAPEVRETHRRHFQLFLVNPQPELRMGARRNVEGMRRTGTRFPMEASLAKFSQGGSWTCLATIRDLTEQRYRESSLRHAATHDNLTGLLNREAFVDRVSRALHRSERGGHQVCVLHLDIDRFKSINDTLGHALGDELLRQTAKRLLASVGRTDSVARLASDEFVVLVDRVTDPGAINQLAEAILQAVSHPVALGTAEVICQATLGIALSSAVGQPDAEELLGQADTALHAAKHHHRGTYRYFDCALQRAAEQRINITNDLRSAISRDQLHCTFQPMVDASEGKVVAAELLLRWEGPSGWVEPAHFIPVAEATGMIRPIGRWTFAQGCAAEVRWRQRWGTRAPRVSINVSPKQLLATEVEAFAGILAATGAQPGRIILEITESGFMESLDLAGGVVAELADLGLQVGVDDFGTGYSSLAVLTQLPVSLLKVDRSFLASATADPAARAILDAITAMSASLGLNTVAEGVETPQQHQLVRDLGFSLVQGFEVARPMPEAELAAFIEATNLP